MISTVKYAVGVMVCLFTIALGANASEYGIPNYSNIPTSIGPDANYNISFEFTKPDDVEKVDIQLALKHPASGYQSYGVVRETFTCYASCTANFWDFRAVNDPPAGEGYIWEIKFLDVDQEGEENPLFYDSRPVMVKESGFLVSNFDAPAVIEPYNTYEITIDYLNDQAAWGYIALVSDETGEEVLRIDGVYLGDTNEPSSNSYSTEIVNDPTPGSYSWDLVLRSNDDETVLIKSAGTEVVLNDLVKNVNAFSSAIAPGMTRDVNVTYTASEARELLVELWSSDSSDYRMVRQAIPYGSGTVTVPMEVPLDIDTDNDYHWWVKIVPIGGQWFDKFHELGTDAVVAANPTQAHFFNYPVYYFPGESFSSTKGITTYTTRIDENLDGSNAAIYVKQENSSSYTEYVFNLVSGDITVTRYYSWSGVSTETITNPYVDISSFKSYRETIGSFSYAAKSASEGFPQVNDAVAFLGSIDHEFNGDYVSGDSLANLRYGLIFRYYNFDFEWQSATTDNITISTNGVTVGEGIHAGFVIRARAAGDDREAIISFDLETGIIVVTDPYVTEIETKVYNPPYGSEDGDVSDYVDVLNNIEAILHTVAAGVKEGDSYVTFPAPQLLEYADNINALIRQLNPIPLTSADLHFPGEVAAFDYEFSAEGPSNHPPRWRAWFSVNDSEEWILRTTMYPSIPTGAVETLFNFATGRLSVFDATGNEVREFTVYPPVAGESPDDYIYALDRVIEHVEVIETTYNKRRYIRPNPQLAQVREYFEAIRASL